MNKKILTRVLSFVLVLCLLVPVITGLGFDFSITAEAAAVEDSNTAYFKAGTANYSKNGTKGTATYEVISKDGVLYIPTATIKTVFDATVFAALETVDGESVYHQAVTIDGISYIPVVDGAEIVKGSTSSVTHTYIYFSVSNMNLIALSKTANVLSGVSNDDQITLMKTFIFDHISSTGSESAFTGLTSTSHPYLLADQDQFDYLYSVYSGETDEPVLKSYLDTLMKTAAYSYSSYATSDTDASLKGDGTDAAFSLVTGQTSVADMPYYTSSSDSRNGYDVGGRQNESATHTRRIMQLAFAYQVTREQKYAELALNYAVAICQWEHWGAGHFLNAADAASYMALAYDWCYNIWGTIDSTKRDSVRDGLFIKGVWAGILTSSPDTSFVGSNGYHYYTTDGTTDSGTYSNVGVNTGSYFTGCPWYDPQVSFKEYSTMTNNWNAVCTSGMVLAALALYPEEGNWGELDVTAIVSGGGTVTTKANVRYKSGNKYYTIGSAIGGDTYAAACAWLINDNLNQLENNGLSLYVPDGSYIESASYWDYGTNSLFELIGALDSACGTDYGLSSTWGLDRTAYYSYYVQSSDGDVWKYHDDNNTSIDTSLNAVFGGVVGDDNIVSYRKYLVAKGAASVTIYDALAYDPDISDTAYEDMSLDYYMEGIQGYTMRDSWHADSAYVAFMGGKLNPTHGQLDSGAFVYYNNGTKWFQDIGTENYNVANFGYGQNYYSFVYYPVSAEGNNTLISSSLPYGQLVDLEESETTNWWGKVTAVSYAPNGVSADIKTYASTVSGGYAILDQSEAYGVDAQRGILMTNDRKTVVIQDEVSFSSSQTSYWIGHLSDDIEITLSSDGRIAYLTDGSTIIRCTIVTDSADTVASAFTFSVMDCAYGDQSGFLLPYGTTTDAAGNVIPYGTDYTGNYSVNNGGVAQNDYSQYQRLVVTCANVTDLKLAVVIEEINPGDDAPTDYTWTSMDSWDSAIKSNSNVADNTVLIDKDFDNTGIGTFESTSGNYRVVNTVVNDGDNAMGVYSTDFTVATNLTLRSASSRVENANIGSGMIVAEFDIATLDRLPDGMTLQFWGTDIYPILELNLRDTFRNVGKNFVHITVIFDEGTHTYYVFEGADCIIASSDYKLPSYAEFAITFADDDGGAADGTLLLDNVLVRRYTESYTGLDSVLGSTADSCGSITSWEEKDLEHPAGSPKPDVVAYIYNAVADAPSADVDTPVVDIWGDGTATDVTPGASYSDGINKTEVSTFDELAALIATGDYTDVELNYGCVSILNIENSITIHTGGYDFAATSSSLVCTESGGKLDYAPGEVTVYYIVNGVKTTVTYTSTEFASNPQAIGTIREVASIDETTGNTVYSYYCVPSDKWSTTLGGAAQYGADIIITSANNTFYIAAEELYEGLYVTVKDGVVTAGGTAEDFFKKAFLTSVGADRISLTNDITFDAGSEKGATGINGVHSGNVELCLNGYSLTFVSSGDSAHFMAVSNGSNLDIYGPGKLYNKAEIGCMFFMALPEGYATDSFERNYVRVFGVDITSTYSLSNHRSGNLEFHNCNIVSERTSGGELFSSYTYAGGHQNVTNEDLIPHLIIDACTVNARTCKNDSCVISTSDNSELTIMGGTDFDAPNSPALICVAQNAGVALKKINLGEFTYNCPLLYLAGGSNASQLTDEIIEAMILSGESAGYTASDALATFGATDLAAGKSDKISDGYVIAYTGSEGYYYKIIPEAEAAKVTWKHGDTTPVTQYWVPGVTPRILDGAKSQLPATSDGRKYTYDMSGLDGGILAAGQEVTFNSMEMPALSIQMSMKLQSEFLISFYFERYSGVTYNYFQINDEKYYPENAQTETLNGTSYYVISVGIAPKDAMDNIAVFANITEGGNTNTILVSASIANYAKQYIDKGTDDVAQAQLMVSILDYIGAIAGYEGDTFTKNSVAAISDYCVAQGVAKNSDYTALTTNHADTSNIAAGISSASLDLTVYPRFVFGIKSGFSGTITFTYTSTKPTLGDDGLVTETITVTDGLVDGSGKYTVDMTAYDIDKDITITVNGSSSVYNLDAYYTAAVQDRDALYELLVALKAYCATADNYVTSRLS